MNLLDQSRIAWAVSRYDFWMDSRGVPRRARKELRQELTANLTDATAHAGSRAAVLAIGSPRALAEAAGEAHEGRPRWSYAAGVAGLVLAALSYAWMFTLFGFSDGVIASGVTGREVSQTSFPWGTELTATVEPGNTAFSVGGTFPWVIVVVTLLVFLLAAQPWRPFTRGRRRSAASTPQRA
ncbi:hypothetical protein GCM10009867_06900 [Pedococcus aerophilus]|uniref:DUF1700 domain-containing protein n=1 Tax=Pedococcus aerophilus TaxID=436356 RepID=A0ABN3UJU5_9MICO